MAHLDYRLPEPKPDQAYVEVSALEGGMLDLPDIVFIQGGSPEHVTKAPSLAFYLRHKPSGAHVLFDLGFRRDTENYAPAAQAMIAKYFNYTVPQSVEESLEKGGIKPEEVKTIVLSHLHFDHVGDAASFPNATFVLGDGSRELLENGYPTNPQSDIHQETVPLDRTRFLTADHFNTSIGPFPRAHDYFGDGSLYIIDAVGHIAGHVNVLARTSATGSWIHLAGDAAHDRRLLTGEKEVAHFVNPATGQMLCAHVNKEQAVEHIKRIGSLLKVPGVHVLLAHDVQWYEKNKGGDAFLPGVILPMPL